MPGTPPNFLSRFHRAISDFQRDRYSQQGEPGPIFGARGDSVVQAEQSVAARRRVEEEVEMQVMRKHDGHATEQPIPAVPNQHKPVAEAVSEERSQPQEGTASAGTSENPEPQLSGASQLLEWKMAPAAVARQRRPIETSQSRTDVVSSLPQPLPHNAGLHVAAAAETTQSGEAGFNRDHGLPESKSARATTASPAEAAEPCGPGPAAPKRDSTLTTAMPTDETDQAETENSKAAEELTDNVQRPLEAKLHTTVASSPRTGVASKVVEPLPEPVASLQRVNSSQESTDVKQLLKELGRTTEVAPVRANPAQDRKPVAMSVQKLAPRDSVELRPDPQYPCVLDRSMAVGPESFSILRSRLLNVHASAGTKTVLITSAETGEGKTLITMNLAMSLGLLGKKRILLVDGDLRKRTVTETLNLHHTQGLSDFLEGTTPFSKVVRATDVSMLFVVSAGHIADGVLPEILEGPRWREFLDTAKEQFDLILIDSVPSGAPLADFELLMAPCDAALMVVRMRKTTREGLVRAMQRIDEKRLLGIVLNNSDHMQRYKYDGYYGYGKGT